MKTTKCRKITQVINNMLRKCLFRVDLGNKISDSKMLNNGLPQNSVLVHLLLNMYISEITESKSRKFHYADDLALTTHHSNLINLEETLSEDLMIPCSYFRKLRLTPSLAKSESCCSHLNNRQTQISLNVLVNDNVLPYTPTPKYLGDP